MTAGSSSPPIRTKIVATIGPASRETSVLRGLSDAGVRVFRLNFSHGTYEEHSAVLERIRALERETGKHFAILVDLCGPKLRLGPIPGDVVECPVGEEFILATERTSEDPHILTCSYRDLPRDLKLGEVVLFADGTVAMTVVETGVEQVRLKVTLPGRLRSRQGVNLPNSALNMPSLTTKDLEDLNWIAENDDDVQYVGLSFARTARDVIALRCELAARKCTARIIVKIEKPQAVVNLEAIIAETDSVMVARGDLGVEMEVARVPAIQKRVITLCNQTHRPVITATQMLNSMEHSSQPTRAEATDVFNAVLDGTDAVMLSGETAIGQYPVEAAQTMRRICAEAEAFLEPKRRHFALTPSLTGLVKPITEATVDAACLAAEELNAPLLIVSTASGRTAQALSNRRSLARILALAPSENIARILNLCWGVTPVILPPGHSVDQELAFALDWAKERQLVHPGQHVVFVRGELPGQARSRTILTHEVGE
jgi:pyruvate kinase